MKKVPVKPEHAAEFRYLLNEAEHRHKMGASHADQAEAIRLLARRQAQLYPECHGRETGFEEEGGQLLINIYDSKEEWQAAILESARENKKAPYVGFAGNPGFPVMGGDK